MTINSQLPPGPTPTPEELWRLEEDPFAAFVHYRDTYGDLFTLRRHGKPPRVFLSDPEQIHEILVVRDRHLEGCGTSLYGDLAGPSNLSILQGQEHRRMRQLVTPALVGSVLRSRAPTVEAIIAEEFCGLRGAASQPLTDLTLRLTMRTITAVVFDEPPDERALNQAFSAVLNTVHQARRVPAVERSSFTARFQRQRTDLDEILLTEIARHRRAPSGNALLARLLAAPDRLCDQTVRDQLVTVMVGGAKTVSYALAMVLYWLHRLPEVADRVAAELRNLPPSTPALSVAALPYLTAVCDETLRIGSVTPTGSARRVKIPFTAFGHEFPAGTELIVAIHLVHRRNQTFPEPDRFNPDRFLTGGFSATEYLPFGTGARRCPGSSLTELQMRLTAARSLRTPGFELINANIPFRPLSHGAALSMPATILVNVHAGV